MLHVRAGQRARSKLLAKVRSHHGLSAALGGHTRATDQFLHARDEATRVAKPRATNWHALPLRGLAPVGGPKRTAK